LFHIAAIEKSQKCKMEENLGDTANVGKSNEPSLGLVIIAACWHAMSDELICIGPSFTLPVLSLS
jgi:hypothetical protein